ncbi:MAG: AarF/UbiB family protein [Candidatus Midichloria sp.]|nr:MAG: AarF/UbiB family protein [Candidatus Midichloria sp.]
MQVLLNAFRLYLLIFTIVKEGLVIDLIRLKRIKTEEGKKLILDKISKKIVLILPKFGPAFVKTGQFLATRPDIVGDTVSKNLEKLQDSLPACDFSQINAILSKSIAINEFKYIDPIAVAAASIAQVHKAQTINNELVAIKVLKPGIKAEFKSNLSLLRFAGKLIQRIFDVKRLKVEEIISRVKKTSFLEMDLRIEAAAADKLRENLSNDENVYVPKIFWKYTTNNVLVLEWIEGIPLYDRERLTEAGFNLENIVKKFAITFFNQAYRDGFFHADLHPGNVLVNANEDIVFLDFGIMGHLDHMNKLFIAGILKSFLERNYDLVAKLHLEAEYFPKSESINVFALSCRSIGETILNKSPDQVSISALLKQLFETAKNFNMEIQPPLLLLQKTMMTVEGISIYLDNQVNIWLLIKPWIKKWAKSNLGIKGRLLKNASNAENFVKDIVDIISLGKKQLTILQQKNTKR